MESIDFIVSLTRTLGESILKGENLPKEVLASLSSFERKSPEEMSHISTAFQGLLDKDLTKANETLNSLLNSRVNRFLGPLSPLTSAFESLFPENSLHEAFLVDFSKKTPSFLEFQTLLIKNYSEHFIRPPFHFSRRISSSDWISWTSRERQKQRNELKKANRDKRKHINQTIQLICESFNSIFLIPGLARPALGFIHSVFELLFLAFQYSVIEESDLPSIIQGILSLVLKIDEVVSESNEDIGELAGVICPLQLTAIKVLGEVSLLHHDTFKSTEEAQWFFGTVEMIIQTIKNILLVEKAESTSLLEKSQKEVLSQALTNVLQVLAVDNDHLSSKFGVIDNFAKNALSFLPSISNHGSQSSSLSEILLSNSKGCKPSIEEALILIHFNHGGSLDTSALIQGIQTALEETQSAGTRIIPDGVLSKFRGICRSLNPATKAIAKAIFGGAKKLSMNQEALVDLIEDTIQVFFEKNLSEDFSETLSIVLNSAIISAEIEEILSKPSVSLYFENRFLSRIQKILAPFVDLKAISEIDESNESNFLQGQRKEAMMDLAAFVSLRFSFGAFDLIPSFDKLKVFFMQGDSENPKVFLPLLSLILKKDDSFFFKTQEELLQNWEYYQKVLQLFTKTFRVASGSQKNQDMASLLGKHIIVCHSRSFKERCKELLESFGCSEEIQKASEEFLEAKRLFSSWVPVTKRISLKKTAKKSIKWIFDEFQGEKKRTKLSSTIANLSSVSFSILISEGASLLLREPKGQPPQVLHELIAEWLKILNSFALESIPESHRAALRAPALSYIGLIVKQLSENSLPYWFLARSFYNAVETISSILPKDEKNEEIVQKASEVLVAFSSAFPQDNSSQCYLKLKAGSTIERVRQRIGVLKGEKWEIFNLKRVRDILRVDLNEKPDSYAWKIKERQFRFYNKIAEENSEYFVKGVCDPDHVIKAIVALFRVSFGVKSQRKEEEISKSPPTNFLQSAYSKQVESSPAFKFMFELYKFLCRVSTVNMFYFVQTI